LNNFIVDCCLATLINANIEKRIIAAVSCKIFLQEFAKRIGRTEERNLKTSRSYGNNCHSDHPKRQRKPPIAEWLFLCFNNCGGYLLYQV
jgi:hypothetical protein